MKLQGIILLLFFTFFGCCREDRSDAKDFEYTTIDYLEVARIFLDSIKTYPVVYDIRNKQKHLVFIGTNHVNRVTHQADSIENIFNRFKPQLAFNEGGSIDSSRHFNSRNEAISQAAEIGELKYLCDLAGIGMVNGDLDDSTEWNELFLRHSRKEVMMYMSNERFIDLYARGWIDTTAGLQATYQKEFIDYYTRRGINFSEEEKYFSFIEHTYKDIFGEDLDIYNIPGENFYFLSNGSKLCALGRNSKMIRDHALLSKIEKAFQKYDRILVVFGGAHAVALRPALAQLVANLE